MQETTRKVSFTLDHPFLTVLLLITLMALFWFAAMFPPLIFVPEKRLEWLVYEFVPFLCFTASGVVLLRSALWKMSSDY